MLLLGVFAVFVALLAGMSVYRSERANAATVNLFSDSFATNGATIPGSWTDSDGAGTNAHVTSNTLQLRVNASAAIGVDTTGYTDIVVNFSCFGDDDNGDSDDLVVEYSSNGGSTWTTGATFDTNNSSGGGCQDDDWRDRSVDLSAVAAIENNASFVVRFRSVGHTSQTGSDTEDVNIDNVVITGFQPDVDTDSDGIPDATDQCPGTAPGATTYYGSGCSVAQYIGMLNPGTANTISGNFCAVGDFNFVIDMSGSIGPQDGSPSNLPAMQAGITGFVNAYNAPAPGSGDGRYSGTRFNGSGTAGLTGGFVVDSTFNTAVNALTNPNGLTPTAAGINAAVANNGGDRPAAPNMMFVVTDGSPNNPPGSPLGDPMTWVNAANAAITAADNARASYLVRAIYVSAPGDPGDTTLPFNDADKALWAQAVMDRIDGSPGGALSADFSNLATDLLNASGCNPSIVKSDGTVNVGAGTITWTIDITNLYGVAKTFTIQESDSTALLTAETCTNSPTIGSAAPWACEVPANGGTAQLAITTALPANFNACDGGQGSNTASLYDGTNKLGEDSGSWSHPGGVGCPPAPGTLIIGKVKDPTAGVPAADNTLFGGTIANGNPATWSGLGFGLFVSSSQPSGVQLTVDETSPTSGWTEVGWAAGSLDTQNNPVCPAGKASYTGSNVGVNLTANQTQVVCVMNTKAPETRNLEICKVVVGNGDLAVRSGSFNFNVFVGGVQVHNGLPGGGINASEPNPDSNPGANGTEVCKTVAVNTSQTVQVVEWGSRPTGWDSPANDAADYPKYSINGGVQVANGTTEVIPAGSADLKVSFYNREKLPTKNVTFQKYICDTLGDVSRNEGSGGVDQVGMPSISAAGGLSGQLNQTAAPAGSSEAVNPSNDGRGNCHLWGSDLTKYPEETGTWDMVIYDNGRNEPPLQTVNIPQGGTISVPLTSAVLLEALKANSDGARVEEVFKAGYGFGSLKCYTDHLNQDNWEWLDFSGGLPTG
ncbi:MAG: VWA domain-containing protein, partial [Gemmatimonadales bacterium]|nr:VWA domain-containing protein [Gemmatimonadales bacterium]